MKTTLFTLLVVFVGLLHSIITDMLIITWMSMGVADVTGNYFLLAILPAEIISKKKHGFGLPFGVWACENPALMKLARDAVYGLQDRGLVQETYITKLFADDLPSYPNYYGEMVWILMMLELWLQNHAPDWQVAD